MRPIDVLNNLKGWVMWPQSYHLSESEAQTCIDALSRITAIEDIKAEIKTFYKAYGLYVDDEGFIMGLRRALEIIDKHIDTSGKEQE